VWERANLRYARRILFTFPRTNGDWSDAPGPDIAPRLMFPDGRIRQLSALLAAECAEPSELGQLYGDGLATALLTALAQRSGGERALARGGLSPHHLCCVTEYIAEKWAEPIYLRELAEMTGLSQSHFGRMFKVSTGVPPHKWHLRIRIQRAQELLIERRNSATDVALAAGFADQSHFTRIFRQVTGMSPGVWQRQRTA
jgi:transcriptional regulator GlxA family with amidase domain